MHKRVASAGRAALRHKRVVMLVYCYVNMRLLENVDEDVLNMLEDAIADAVDEADAIASGTAVVPDDDDDNRPSRIDEGVVLFDDAE